MSATESEQFNAKVGQGELDEYLSAIDAFADEAIIEVDESGIKTEAVDPANVGMVSAELTTPAFAQFEHGVDEIGVRTGRLINTIERMGAHVSLEYDASTRKIDVGGERFGYTHACIDPDSIRDSPSIPNMDLGFRAKLNVDVLREAVEWFDEFASHVRVGYDTAEGVFWMEANESGRSGVDYGDYKLGRSEFDYVYDAGEASSHFALDYFMDIVTAIPEGYPVTISVGEEFPMEISYGIAWEETAPGEGVSHGEVTFMQAPRIQSD
jgi:hypothetical protein